MYNNHIEKIAILGAGTMGPGIAQSFLSGGCKVKVWEPIAERRKPAEKIIREGLTVLGDNQMLDSGRIDEFMSNLEFTDSLASAVEDVQLIMETIVEKIEAKKDLYNELIPYIKDNTIIASNTSALNIFEIVPEELLKNQFIAHWYGPAQLIPLVEVIKSEEAPQEKADILIELLKRCGKVPVQMKKFIRGYIVNRLLQCINREVFYLLDNEICTAEDVDFAVKNSFIPRAMVLGICRKIDFGGVDMTINNYKNHSYQLPPEVDLPETLKRMEEKGEFGIKSGKGFYDYTGCDINELLNKRDEQLIKAYKLAGEFLNDPA